MDTRETDAIASVAESVRGAVDVLRALAWHGDISTDAVRFVANQLDACAEKLDGLSG